MSWEFHGNSGKVAFRLEHAGDLQCSALRGLRGKPACPDIQGTRMHFRSGLGSKGLTRQWKRLQPGVSRDMGLRWQNYFLHETEHLQDQVL